MLKFNIKCIEGELQNIILNRPFYNDEIIVYALGFFETVNIIDNTNKLSDIFIKILHKLVPHVNCDLDFNFLKDINDSKKDIMLVHDNLGSSFLQSSSSGILEDKINTMLVNDSKLINMLVTDNNNIMPKTDDYGNIDDILLANAKKLFDLIDKNHDGFISALDIISIDNNTNKFVFDSEIINLLLLYGKIDFNQYFYYLI
jgi:hypothetical protein